MGGRGWGGGRGRWEAEGGLKQPFGFKQQCCVFSMGLELVQSTGWAKTAVRSSLVPHAVPSEPRNASSWFYSIGKKPSVKEHLAKLLVFLGSA